MTTKTIGKRSTTKRAAPLSIPPLAKPRKIRAPQIVSQTLPNGLRVIAMRKRGAPVLEARLRIPVDRNNRSTFAKGTVLAETMLKGTKQRPGTAFEQDLGLTGGTLDVSFDRDKIRIGGMTLVDHAGQFLQLLADALLNAAYTPRTVDAERARLIERIAIAGSSSGVIAAKTLASTLYGQNPYGIVLPEAADMVPVTAATVRALHRKLVLPHGALLVLVGDLSATKAIALAEAAFGDWTGSLGRVEAKVPQVALVGPLVLVDRPDAVQSSIHFGGAGLDRFDPGHPAQLVANTIFGGNFSSRLVANLREDKGYTYSPRSALDLGRLATTFSVVADVATDVTAASINEIEYELRRMVSTSVQSTELEAARDYLIGSSSLALATQAGLATSVANLEFAGASLDWMRELLVSIGKVTAQDVAATALRMMRPTLMRTVVVGAAAELEIPLAAIVPAVESFRAEQPLNSKD